MSTVKRVQPDQQPEQQNAQAPREFPEFMSKKPKASQSSNWPDEEQIIRQLRKQPYSSRQLLAGFNLSVKQKPALSRCLQRMVASGQIVRRRGGRYSAPQSARLMTGRLVQTRPGFAFVVPDQAGEKDTYVSAADMKNAVPDDRVEIQVISGSRGNRTRGKVVRILKRARENITGTFNINQGKGWIKVDGWSFMREFFISPGRQGKARDGDQVVARVDVWPTESTPGRANVIEVLGSRDRPGVDITMIVRRFGLPDKFSSAALTQAREIAQEPAEAVYTNRKDLRLEQIFTIDGEDARDFDDAVSCQERPEGGWRLGVHIADVSYYLSAGTVLDREAYERGTSVYFPDRVLHMLPEELSCRVCSLVPGRDRFTVSAGIDIAPDGRIVHTAFYRSVIRSRARLTYNGVEEILQGGRKSGNPAWDFIPELKLIYCASQALRARRQARGSLDFDLPDSRIVLGPDGRVKTIEKQVQLASHGLIEDCMIAANEAVAGYLARTDTPALYRAHEPPAGEKLEELKEILRAYGYALKPGKSRESSRSFQELLLSWQGRPEASVLNTALLRAMKQALYAPKNLGHFGLASPCYTHFTSPIRRYPDLIVHRMLIERLEKGALAGRRRADIALRMPAWGEQLSLAERRAEKAEREAVKVKQVEFMQDKVGEIFAGLITTVTNFGFFVELEEYFVEGLVRAASLEDDYYCFEDRQRHLAGVNTGREFRTGDRLMVKVMEVDRDEMRVILMLHEDKPRHEKRVRKNPPRVIPQRRRKRL